MLRTVLKVCGGLWELAFKPIFSDQPSISAAKIMIKIIF